MGIILLFWFSRDPKSLLTLTQHISLSFLFIFCMRCLCCDIFSPLFPNHNMILLFLDHMKVPKGYYFTHTHTKQYPIYKAYITIYSLYLLFLFFCFSLKNKTRKKNKIINACKKSSSNILKDIKYYTKHI